MTSSTRPRQSYVVVHTLGGDYTDAATFTDDGSGSFTYAYTDALDLANEIREHADHYARIDRVFIDAAMGQQAGSRVMG